MATREFFEPAARTTEAIGFLEQVYNKSGGVFPDKLSEYEGIQAWIWVPSAYSAIEQGMKLFIKSHKGNQIWGHRLSELYEKLCDKHRRLLDYAYEKYVELHSYIPHRNLKPFLDQLDVGSRSDGKKTRWDIPHGGIFFSMGFQKISQSSRRLVLAQCLK